CTTPRISTMPSRTSFRSTPRPSCTARRPSPSGWPATARGSVGLSSTAIPSPPTWRSDCLPMFAASIPPHLLLLSPDRFSSLNPDRSDRKTTGPVGPVDQVVAAESRSLGKRHDRAHSREDEDEPLHPARGAGHRVGAVYVARTGRPEPVDDQRSQ